MQCKWTFFSVWANALKLYPMCHWQLDILRTNQESNQIEILGILQARK